MTTFLFWNTGRKDVLDQIAVACREYDVDVLILAELGENDVSLLLALNASGGPTYVAPFNPSARLTFATRYPIGALIPVQDEIGVAIRLLRPPVGIEVLVVAVHMPSKMHRSGNEQTILSVRVAEAVRAAEVRVGHANTIIIGDLNMDPYEDGVTAADCLHGVMNKSIAVETGRTVDRKRRDYFYNPMWNRLGDETHGPPGTYFYRGGQVSHFWHTFDQVLLRPSLLPYYSSAALHVITAIGQRDLLRNGRIDPSISDHLPILLRLDLERGG